MAVKMTGGRLKLSKTDVLIICLIVVMPLTAIIIGVFYNVFINPETGKDHYLKTKSAISCHGTIDSIFRQKNNHNILTLRVNGDEFFEVAPRWENKFKVGDSISKHFGALVVEHYREGKQIELLDYRDVGMK